MITTHRAWRGFLIELYAAEDKTADDKTVAMEPTGQVGDKLSIVYDHIGRALTFCVMRLYTQTRLKEGTR